MTPRRVGLTIAMLVLAAAVPASAAGDSGIGSPGLGDPLFKLAGNGGYDVGHYGLALDYEHATGSWHAPIELMLGATVAMLVCGLGAARPGMLGVRLAA